jgi:hypothetical protein
LTHACVSARDEDATRQVLRVAALDLPDAQAKKVATTVHATISGGGKLWMERLVRDR